MGITNLREISKWQYKRIVRKYIHTKAREELLNDIQRYKKLSHDKLSCEPLERKKYLSTLSLENARMRFRVSSSFVQGVRTHFPRKYRPLSLSCPACSDPDASATNENARNVSVSSPINQSHDNLTHILRCEAYIKSWLNSSQMLYKGVSRLEIFRLLFKTNVETFFYDWPDLYWSQHVVNYENTIAIKH